MGEDEKKPNTMIYIVTDLVEDILIRLPLESILRFKTVSKQWRSILESNSFVEKRKKSVEKKPSILAVAEDMDEWSSSSPRFQGDEEINMVYLQCVHATTSLTCDGLVCLPLPNWIIFLNPSTGEFLRIPSRCNEVLQSAEKTWRDVFPRDWAMGFGKDEITGIYKVVRMLFDDTNRFEILDVGGDWRELTRHPPYRIQATRKSACVSGNIYWLSRSGIYFRMLALDLHTEEFRDVPKLPCWNMNTAQIVNLENRLAVGNTRMIPIWKLEIWSLDAREGNWSMTYSISLNRRVIPWKCHEDRFVPLSVSKRGNLYFYDMDKGLFKYYPKTDYLCCISLDICAVAPYSENLVSLRNISTSGYGCRLGYLPVRMPKISTMSSRIGTTVGRIESLVPNILLASALVSLILFGYSYKYST